MLRIDILRNTINADQFIYDINLVNMLLYIISKSVENIRRISN